MGILGAGEYFVPRIPKLFERYPGLSLELVIHDHPPDMIEERLDLAIHRGPIANTSMVARALRIVHFITVAAPSYLERRGEPQVPADLEKHDCILHSEIDRAGWQFNGPDGPYRIRVPSRLAANNFAAIYLAALNGQGIAVLPDFRVFDDIRSGRLRRLLAGHEAPGDQVYIVYPSRRHLASRTRAVIDFLLEQVKELEHQLGLSGPSSDRG